MTNPGTQQLLRLAASTTDRRQLLQVIEQTYRTQTRSLCVGAIHFELTCVADPDQVLQQMEKEAVSAGQDDLAWQPYWAQAWESAIAVGQRLVQSLQPGARVLDVGCGLGLTGAVAASRGAYVLMVDSAPPALLFARLNSWTWRAHVDVRQLDWRRERLGDQRFDWIVGSDVLYDHQDWPHLEEFWRAQLADDGRLIVGEPNRSSARSFPQWMQRRGWRIESAEVLQVPQDSPIRVWLFKPECREPHAPARRP